MCTYFVDTRTPSSEELNSAPFIFEVMTMEQDTRWVVKRCKRFGPSILADKIQNQNSCMQELVY